VRRCGRPSSCTCGLVRGLWFVVWCRVACTCARSCGSDEMSMRPRSSALCRLVRGLCCRSAAIPCRPSVLVCAEPFPWSHHRLCTAVLLTEGGDRRRTFRSIDAEIGRATLVFSANTGSPPYVNENRAVTTRHGQWTCDRERERADGRLWGAWIQLHFQIDRCGWISVFTGRAPVPADDAVAVAPRTPCLFWTQWWHII